MLAIATLGERDEWSRRQPDGGGDGWVPDDGGTFLGLEELAELARGLEVVSLRDEEPELRVWNQGVRRKHVLELVARRSRQLAGLHGHH